MIKKRLVFLLTVLGMSGSAFAETPAWTPLITTSSFDGIRADVTTTCLGLLSILIIIVALSLISRAFTR